METGKNIYYNNSQLLSYNALFSFVVGERGCGKTFSFKDWAIRDFIKMVINLFMLDDISLNLKI